MLATDRTVVQREMLLALTKNPAIDAGERARAFQDICTSASAALGAARVSIWSYDAAHGTIVCEELYDRQTDTHSAGLTLARTDFPAYFDYLREERILAAGDAHGDPATAAFSDVYLKPLGIGAMLDAPIRFQGKLWGVVCHEHVGGERPWSVDEQTFGASMADFAARVLSAERHAAAQRALEELNASLERVVGERTAELARTVETLTCMQARLVESEKLAALGALVAGVAHEVNTPIGVALTAVTAAGEELAALRSRVAENQLKRSELARFLDRSQQLGALVETNLARAADLVRHFKEVAVRQSSEEREVFSFVEAVAASVASLEPEWRRAGHRVRVDGDAHVRMHAVPRFVFHIVSNLVMNALRHAYPEREGGTIAFSIERSAPSTAHLRYADDGIGMGDDALRRMWEPFFTTKRGSGGSGLGLHIVWNLVAELGGSVHAESAPGAGLRISFRFPCLSEAP